MHMLIRHRLIMLISRSGEELGQASGGNWLSPQALVGALMLTRRQGKSAEHPSRSAVHSRTTRVHQAPLVRKPKQTRAPGARLGVPTQSPRHPGRHCSGAGPPALLVPAYSDTPGLFAIGTTPNRIHMHKPTGERVYLSLAVKLHISIKHNIEYKQ